MFSMSDSIQFGFDVATSITIVATAISWARTQKKRNEEALKKGLDERVRSTCLESIQKTLHEFENNFSELLDQAQKLETKVDKRISKNSDGLDFSRLERMIESKPSFIDEVLEELRVIRNSTGAFYDKVQSRRYTLIPMLLSIDNSEEYIKIFESDVDDIRVSYNLIGSGYISLLSEVSDLVKEIDKKRNETTPTDKQEFFSDCFHDDIINARMKSILFDESFYIWTNSFVPNGKEDDYLEKIIKPDTIEDAELCKHVFINFLSHMINEPTRMLSQILFKASGQLQKTRVECKDILISLSAMSGKLVSKVDERPLTEWIEELASEEYFDRNGKVR